MEIKGSTKQTNGREMWSKVGNRRILSLIFVVVVLILELFLELFLELVLITELFLELELSVP